MGGKAGSDSGQILVQNRLKPRSGSDKIEPAAGGAQTGCPDKKYSQGMAQSGALAQCVVLAGLYVPEVRSTRITVLLNTI